MAETSLPEGTDTIISESDTTAMGTTSDDLGGSTSGATSGGFRDSLRSGGDKLRSTATDKAMGLVGQGLQRSGEALGNVSALIGDTAASLDERLGTQYGDYARSAAEAIDRAATTLSTKEPDELFDDARSLVRKSPGIALAGAAILGFALVRVVKSGLDDDRGSRSRKSS